MAAKKDPRKTTILPAQRDHFFSLLAQGYPIGRAAREAGFSERMGYRYMKDRRQMVPESLSAQLDGLDHRGFRKVHFGLQPEFAVPPEQWSAHAHEAMNDRTGAIFMKRYFGMVLAPWQCRMWETLEELWDAPDREFVCVNAPPGLGKSTVLVGFAAKRTVDNRRIRGLFMSRAHSLAERNTLRLRRALERTAPFTDAITTLSTDFGRFKPRNNDLWRSHEFIVEQYEGSMIEEKEPTWAAFGFDAQWLGNRIDLLIGDDLDSSTTVRNLNTVEANQTIFDNELEPRVERGGMMVVAQQRLGAFDFSSHVLAKRILPDDEVEHDEAQDEDGEPKYRHVIFKAHYEEICKGPGTHRLDSPPYPEGCMLDPRQFTWRDMRSAMRNPRTFELVYQQNDLVAESGLVKRVWIDGGVDADGIMHPGCWDDRRTWQMPGDYQLAGELIPVITCDPSPSEYWAVEAWLYHPISKQRFLVGLERGKMEAPDFLDWSHSLGEFTGMLEDFRVNFTKMGCRLEWVIVEINAAQRFMLQYDHFHRWMRLHDVQVIPHSTQRNKHDPELGVEMLASVYRQGLVRLPDGAGTIRHNRLAPVNRLIDEVTRYPNTRTTDCLMAQWFLEANLDKIYTTAADANRHQWRPSWLVNA